MLEGGAAAQTGGVVSPLWAETVDGDQSTFETSPTVVGDRIYIGTNNGVRGYNVSNGKLAVPGPDTGVAATPRVRDGTLYTIQNADNSPGLEELSASDSVVALDPTDGSVVGETTARDTIDTTYPVIADGAVFLGVQDVQLTSNNYYFRAIDIESDTVRWEQETNRAANPPTVADGTVYAADDGFGGSTGYAFDAAGGDINWTVSLNDDRDRAVPVVADGTVLFGGAAFDFDGNEQWRSDNPLGTPTVADGTVFAFDSDSDGTLRAINLADGSDVWSSPVDTGGSTDTSAPTVAGDSVFVSSDDGLMSVSADTGEIQWRANLGAPVTSPVVVDGVVFALTAAGRLVALPSEVAGSSRGARVQGGVRNHHHGWANVGEPDLPATLSLTPESVSLRNLPVERGGAANDPIVQVAGVTDADIISLEATYDDGSTEQTETFSFQAVNASAEAVDQASALTQVTLETDELDPGTWVDLEIVDDDGNTAVDSLAIDHPEDGWLLEGDDLGYHVFETVEDARLVFGSFADQTVETADLRALAEARVRDVNYFLGSPRGLLGDVGLDIDVAGVDRGGYTVDSESSYSSVEAYTDDLKDAYTETHNEAPGADKSLWAALQPGNAISFNAGLHMPSADRIYVTQKLPWPTPQEVDGERRYRYTEGLYVFCHEIGHAYGLRHTTRQTQKTGISEACTMSAKPAQENRFQSAHNRAEIPSGAFSVIPQLSATVGTAAESDEATEIGSTSDLLSTETVESAQLPSQHSVQARAASEADPNQITVPLIDTGTTRYVVEFRQYIDATKGSYDFEWGTDNSAGVLVYRLGDPLRVNPPDGTIETILSRAAVLDEPETRPRIELVTGWAANFPRGPGPDELVGGNRQPFAFDLSAPKDEAYTQFEVVDVSAEGDTRAAEVSVGNEILDQLADKVVVCLGADAGPPVATHDTTDAVPTPTAGVCKNCIGADSVSASFSLKIRDNQGRLVGQNGDGQYVTEIPGAITSGSKETGVEWIAVPSDTEFDAQVDASEVESYLHEVIDIANNNGGEMYADNVLKDSVVEYRIAETRYGENTEVIENQSDDVIRVPGATTRVQQQTVEVGNQRDATIANPDSSIDLVDIQQATEGRSGMLTFRNRGDDRIDLGGWQLLTEHPEQYIFPPESIEPGAELTLVVSHESSTRQDPDWKTAVPVPSPDGGLLELQTSNGDVALSVVYDARGRIRFDQDLSDITENGDGGIDTLTALGLLGAAGVAGYALKRRLSSESK